MFKKSCICIFTLMGTGCASQVAIEKLQDQLASDSNDAAGDTSGADETTGNFPEPTTSSTTGLPSADMGSEQNGADEVQILAFEASTLSMARAGSIVFTAEVGGPATDLELRIHHPDRPQKTEKWPLEAESFEYVVNSDALNGEVTFELVARSRNDEDSAVLDASVALPPPGTVDRRWTLGGNASFAGTSLAVVPRTGTETDGVIAVGTKNDTPVLIELLDDTLVSTALGGPADFVMPHAIAVDEGALFMAGEELNDEEMVLRKYDLASKAKLWELKDNNARAFDLVVDDGMVIAVGEVDTGDATWAALWQVTESGGGDSTPITFVQYANDFDPLSSGLRGVAKVDGRIFASGFISADGLDKHPRGALLELEGTDLEVLQQVELENDEAASSKWNAIVLGGNELLTAGWYRESDDVPPSALSGRYDLQTQAQDVALTWAGQATGVSTAGCLSGNRRVGETSRFFAQGPTWSVPHTEAAGEWSTAHDVATDRQGYTYVIGSFSENGMSRLVLTRFAP